MLCYTSTSVIGGSSQPSVHVSYGAVAISVLIMGISPFHTSSLTNSLFAVPRHPPRSWRRHPVQCLVLTSKIFPETTFIPPFSPLALLGLLYTILVMFAY